MLGAVDPVVGFGASTRIKFYSEVAISRVNPLPYGKIALSGLELDDIARGFFLPLRVGERLAQFRRLAGDQPARAFRRLLNRE